MALEDVLKLTRDLGDGYRTGLSAYPIFNEDYRVGLNEKIIAHYFKREIAHESMSMFLFALARKMNEIMPWYNQLYLSAQIQFDPLSTFNLKTIRSDTTTETGHRETSSNSTDTNAKSRSVQSTTPQAILAGNADYGSGIADAISDTGGTADTTGTDDTDNTVGLSGNTTTSGYQGAAADLLMKFRNTILNIDMMIVDDLQECFMGVWDDGTPNEEPIRGPRLYIPYIATNTLGWIR